MQRYVAKVRHPGTFKHKCFQDYYSVLNGQIQLSVLPSSLQSAIYSCPSRTNPFLESISTTQSIRVLVYNTQQITKLILHCKKLEVDLTQEMSSQLQSGIQLVPGGCLPPSVMVQGYIPCLVSNELGCKWIFCKCIFLPKGGGTQAIFTCYWMN